MEGDDEGRENVSLNGSNEGFGSCVESEVSGKESEGGSEGGRRMDE